MGKISKALEKAERRGAAGPVQGSLPDRIKPDGKIAKYVARNKPVEQSDQRRIDDTVNRDMRSVERPADAQTLATPNQQPGMPGSAPSSAGPTEAPFPHDHLPSPEARRSDPTVDSHGVAPSDVNRKPDGLNISLVKPEISSPSHAVQRISRDAGAANEITSGKKVRVNYSRTQVQVNDPRTLRENKIISVFDDMETTDQIRILRTQVLRKLKAIGGNSILITSANPYEGKTFTSINLGVSIAKEFDRTVLIIDADVRKPTDRHTGFSTEFFSLSVDKGLTDYLEDDADITDILINPGIDRLTLIPGGMPVNNAPELLNSAKMQEMMAEVKSRYIFDRLVIVDGPAMLPFPDAMILSRYVDGVIPVIEAEKTSAEDIKKMMSHLKEVNILGTVLNKKKG